MKNFLLKQLEKVVIKVRCLPSLKQTLCRHIWYAYSIDFHSAPVTENYDVVCGMMCCRKCDKSFFFGNPESKGIKDENE